MSLQLLTGYAVMVCITSTNNKSATAVKMCSARQCNIIWLAVAHCCTPAMNLAGLLDELAAVDWQ